MKTIARFGLCALIIGSSLQTVGIYSPAYAQDAVAAKAANVDLSQDSPKRLKGAKPAPKSLEEGLWVESAKAEKKATTSGERTKDRAVELYVQSVMDKVMGEHVGESRVLVMERPLFNASMAPNGYTEVWTGLLLRVQTEDELAFVLSHEAGHYLHNHSIRAYQNYKDNQNAAMAASLLIGLLATAAAANAGTYQAASDISNIGSLAIDLIYLGTIASYFGYSRETESYADIYGHAYATKSGYNGVAGENLWQDRVAETQASDNPKIRKSATRSNIFSSHPLDSERIATLKTYHAKISANSPSAEKQTPPTKEQLAYREKIRPYLAKWLAHDLLRRDYGQSLHILTRLLQTNTDLGVIHFYRGEALSMRNTEANGVKDSDEAIKAYLSALKFDDAPVETHRQIGNLYRKLGKNAESVASFKSYLQKAPEAEDAWIIQDMIDTAEKTLQPAPIETPKVETPKVETPKPATPSAEIPPAETPSIETAPAQTAPAQTAPAQTPVPAPAPQTPPTTGVTPQ